MGVGLDAFHRTSDVTQGFGVRFQVGYPIGAIEVACGIGLLPDREVFLFLVQLITVWFLVVGQVNGQRFLAVLHAFVLADRPAEDLVSEGLVAVNQHLQGALEGRDGRFQPFPQVGRHYAGQVAASA